MITEYTDCAELLRLITDQKIKPAAIKSYLRKQGMFFTATNAHTLAEDVYTILLGGQEISSITQMIVSEGNYEKSTLINATIKGNSTEDVLDYFADNFNGYRSTRFQGYVIEQPVKKDSELVVNMSYKRKLPGKNKLIQEETRYIRIIVRKKGTREVSIDIRQPSSFDAQKALDLLKDMANNDENLMLSHINLVLLTDKNKVEFFDRVSAQAFRNWKLKTITGITVKKSLLLDDDEIDEESNETEEENGALAGISQAVLNGSGLRSNEFVQKSIDQGYFIASMKYRYICTQESGEFVIGVNTKGDDLRVDIEKSYSDDDGRLFVQPFPKDQQDEIIRIFQTTADTIFNTLITEQQNSGIK